MAKDPNVKFIRIRGRIVPIRKVKVTAVEKAKVGYQVGANLGALAGTLFVSVPQKETLAKTAKVFGKRALMQASVGAAIGGLAGAGLFAALGRKETHVRANDPDVVKGELKAPLTSPISVALGIAGTYYLGKKLKGVSIKNSAVLGKLKNNPYLESLSRKTRIFFKGRHLTVVK